MTADRLLDHTLVLLQKKKKKIRHQFNYDDVRSLYEMKSNSDHRRMISSKEVEIFLRTFVYQDRRRHGFVGKLRIRHHLGKQRISHAFVHNHVERLRKRHAFVDLSQGLLCSVVTCNSPCLRLFIQSTPSIYMSVGRPVQIVTQPNNFIICTGLYFILSNFNYIGLRSIPYILFVISQ